MNSFSEEMGGGETPYHKIESGSSLVGIICSEAVSFYQRWVDGKSEVCAAGDEGAKPRFALNFATVGEDGKVDSVKILEQGPMVHNQLVQIKKDYPLLNETFLKISKDGAGLNTTYTVMPLPKVVSPALRSELSNLEAEGRLHDLTKKVDSEIPF